MIEIFSQPNKCNAERNVAHFNFTPIFTLKPQCTIPSMKPHRPNTACCKKNNNTAVSKKTTPQNLRFLGGLHRFEGPMCPAVLRNLKNAMQRWRPTGVHARNFSGSGAPQGHAVASNLCGPANSKSLVCRAPFRAVCL